MRKCQGLQGTIYVLERPPLILQIMVERSFYGIEYLWKWCNFARDYLKPSQIHWI